MASFAGIQLYGLFAWLMWLVVHIFFLIGFRNRLAVMLDWLWAYLTFQRSARIILEDRVGAGSTLTENRP